MTTNPNNPKVTSANALVPTTNQNKDSFYIDGTLFRKHYEFKKTLNQGAEGKVSSWANMKSGMLVAVKEPVRPNADDLWKEVEAYKKIGRHPNIVRFIGYDPHWPEVSPAIFIEQAELGDVNDYRQSIVQHGYEVNEVTMWKFMADVSRGLDWIHNNLGKTFVHGDLKPGNILVHGTVSPTPMLPTFKICDVARVRPATKDGPEHRFGGTPEYGPPMQERQARLTPAVDVFAIGGSIQTLALGVLPTMGPQQFIAYMRELGAHVIPTEAELKNPHYTPLWRHKIPPMFRSLIEAKRRQPFSKAFNEWYSMTMEESPADRINAGQLVKYFEPVAKAQVELFQAEQEFATAQRQEQNTLVKWQDARKKRLDNQAKREQRRAARQAQREGRPVEESF